MRKWSKFRADLIKSDGIYMELPSLYGTKFHSRVVQSFEKNSSHWFHLSHFARAYVNIGVPLGTERRRDQGAQTRAVIRTHTGCSRIFFESTTNLSSLFIFIVILSIIINYMNCRCETGRFREAFRIERGSKAAKLRFPALEREKQDKSAPWNLRLCEMYGD